MSPLLSLVLAATFIGLAFLLRGQARYGRLGFGMMIMAGVMWLIVAALGVFNP